MDSDKEVVGKASGGSKNTVIQICLFGTDEGILTDLTYKVFSDNKILESFLQTIKAGISGVAVGDAMEEIIADNILENIELSNEETYIAELIEKVFQKAAIDFIQTQLKITSYEDEE